MTSNVLQFDHILRRSPIGIAVMNFDGVYEAVNAAYCKIYGYAESELLGHNVTKVFPPEVRQRVLALHQKFLTDDEPLGGEWDVVRSDGALLHIISESASVVGEDGLKRRLVYITDITERKKTEKALHDSEERLSLVLRGTLDGYWDIDFVLNERFYSPRWWEMLGYTYKELPLDEDLWRRMTHPDDLAYVNQTLAQAIAGHANHFELEMRMQHKDGHFIHILARGNIVRDPSGKAIRMSGANTDLTQRIQLETEAKQFESIVRSSGDAIVGKSLDGIVTSWNPGAQAMFGYTADEMIGQSLLVLLPMDRRDEEDLILRKLRNGERVEHFETVRIRKDGRRIDVSVTISPIRNPHGHIVGASKIARDITEQKLLESRLLLTSSVFANTNEGIAVIDPHGVTVEVNPAFSRITGYRRNEVIGQSPMMFGPHQQAADTFDNIRSLLRESDHYQGELWSQRKDGQNYAVLLTVSIVRDSLGALQNYVVLFSDITPLRVKQEQLEHVAHFDALTDLPNRLLLADRLQQAMVLTRRTRQSLAVLYLDLDGFKTINDQYGHAAGDELLIAVSGRMKEAMREVDTLARIGGDEFVAVLVDVSNLNDCCHLIQRILQACAEPVVVSGRVLQVSASVGATLYPQDDVDADQLIRHADQAMYKAKQAGKNRIHIFEGVGIA